jgi:hypothetical protein
MRKGGMGGVHSRIRRTTAAPIELSKSNKHRKAAHRGVSCLDWDRDLAHHTHRSVSLDRRCFDRATRQLTIESPTAQPRPATPRLWSRDEVFRQVRTINVAPVIQRHSFTARAVGLQHGEHGAEARGRAVISDKPLSVVSAAPLALRAEDFYRRGTLYDFAEQDVMAGHALLRRHQCFLIPAAMRRTMAASLSRRCCAATTEAFIPLDEIPLHYPFKLAQEVEEILMVRWDVVWRLAHKADLSVTSVGMVIAPPIISRGTVDGHRLDNEAGRAQRST